jgi:glycolate oxidase
LDVFVADEKEKQANILEIRSNIYEAMKSHTMEILDITVPRSDIARFVDAIREVSKEHNIWLPTYGHAADGNVHTHIMCGVWEQGEWKEVDKAEEMHDKIRKILHDIGKQFKGIPSGEHGIGIVKKQYLADFLSERQIQLMRGIKQEFDPNSILNPGKIFNMDKAV